MKHRLWQIGRQADNSTSILTYKDMQTDVKVNKSAYRFWQIGRPTDK
jgi:hypothetical protein